MSGLTCQSQEQLKRRPVAGPECAPAARPRVCGSSSAADVDHVCRLVRPYPLRVVAVADFSFTPAPPRTVSPPPFLYRRCTPCRHWPPPSRLRPPMCSIDTAPTTARVLTIFPSHELPTSTIGRCPSSPFPFGRVTPRGHRPLVSLLLRQWPNRLPHLTIHLSDPRSHLTASSLTGIGATVERRGAPLLRPGAESPRGLGREGCGQVGLSYSNSSISCFSLGINSKFISI
jgi:hypothetical protein